MPTITLEFDVTQTQKDKLDRWFARWNPTNTVPFDTLEDALKDVVVQNVKSFISEDNLIKIEDVKEAFRNTDDTTQDQILDLLGL